MKKKLRFIALPAILAVLVVASAAPLTHAAASIDESTVKVKLLYNFMKFVTWPQQAATYNVCVLGTNPFGAVVNSLNGQQIGGRPIRVIAEVSLNDAKYCQVVFVSRSESGRLTNALLNLRQPGILTVSDIEGFADKGGVIEIIISSSGKPEFRISQKSAQDVGLRVGSQLLGLSK